ncbi:MAG: helicase-associated domain-containing protein, partial [Deltaproteobacteria bacterium]|nr:helicase-associated domain-containing protein [Deltaproteobacteria bacterium]
MISTNHLIHSIPSYILGVISTRILGDATDANVLATWLNDPARLKDVLSIFTQAQRRILFDLYELGGQAQWSLLTKIYGDQFDDLKGQLKLFGSYGIVYQGGLSGRDPVILLPSLIPLLEDIRQTQDRPGNELVWTSPPDISIWDHIVLLNTIRAEKIRCRFGMEPFKKGWQLLDDKLDKAIQISEIYWELVELGCIRGIKGRVTVQNAAAVSLAMEGDLRLKIWRFLQLCKTYPGLDGLLLRVLDNQGTTKSRVERTIYLFLIKHFKNLTNEEAVGSEIVSSLMDQGVIQEDSTRMWLRLLPEVHLALKTGNVDKTNDAYMEEVIIQPNMEILVPGDFDPLDHLHVGEIADIVRADVVSIYRITRASIYRALLTGWNYKMIERLLGRISQRAVPDNVLKNVSLWSGALRKAHVIKGTFLVLQDAKPELEGTLEEIMPGIYRIPER